MICDVIKDLLLLYEEGECSEGTKAFVEEHLKECKECKAYFEERKMPEDFVVPDFPATDIKKEEQAIKKSFRKIRNRWAASLIAIFMIFPVAGVSFLGINQSKGEGICFTNLQEITVSKQFVKLLEEQKWEEAAEMLDFSREYYDIRQAEDDISLTYYDQAVLVDLGGETWGATYEFAEKNHITETGEHELSYDKRDFWMNIIWNGQNDVWIPEEIWSEMVTDFRTEYEGGVGEVYIPVSVLGEEMHCQSYYCQATTKWGNFYIDSGFHLVTAEEITAADIVGASSLVPGEIYEAAREQVEAEAVERTEWFYEEYAEKLAMTQEEYEEAAREEFVKKMEIYQEEGWTLTYRGFDDAYRGPDDWQIQIKVKENKGNRTGASLVLHVDGKKISGHIGAVEETYMTDEVLGLIKFLELRGE